MVVEGIGTYPPPAYLMVYSCVYSHRAMQTGCHQSLLKRNAAQQQLRAALAPTSLKLNCLMHILLNPAQTMHNANAVFRAGPCSLEVKGAHTAPLPTTCPCQQCSSYHLDMGPPGLDLTCRVAVKGASTAPSPISLKLRCALT